MNKRILIALPWLALTLSCRAAEEQNSLNSLEKAQQHLAQAKLAAKNEESSVNQTTPEDDSGSDKYYFIKIPKWLAEYAGIAAGAAVVIAGITMSAVLIYKKIKKNAIAKDLATEQANTNLYADLYLVQPNDPHLI